VIPTMSRSSRWALALLATGVFGLAGCGYSSPPAGAGHSGSVNLSLTTVKTIRSVTVSVSPAQASFGNCTGGTGGPYHTPSTASQLGFPNGRCWVGLLGASYPITIKNTGIASIIDVNGASAVPSDDITGWSLCNIGDNPAVTCTGRNNNLPGMDQYLVQNFGPYGENDSGLTDNPQCDHEFDSNGRCWALEGAAQTEGIELTGPVQSSDNSTNWTVTITWTPVP
jgi:hypothetical protein